MDWIKGFVGISLIEYPGKVTSVVFTGGCPFRCPFCHNGSLVLGQTGLSGYSEEVILSRLKLRSGFCDGIVISGGEPLMHSGLEKFIRQVKEMGLLVKLETNGYFPEPLSRLLESRLLDFVSMDLKTSINKYNQAAGVYVDWWRIEHSIALLNNNPVDHEFRTTLVPGLVTRSDIPEMAMVLGRDSKWVLQSFRPKETLDPAYSLLAPYNEKQTAELLSLARSVKPNVKARFDFNPEGRHFNQKAVSINA